MDDWIKWKIVLVHLVQTIVREMEKYFDVSSLDWNSPGNEVGPSRLVPLLLLIIVSVGVRILISYCDDDDIEKLK